MNIHVRWDNEEQTIIRWHFPARWTWDDYYGAVQISRQLAKQAPYIVDVIVDMRSSEALPKNVFTHAKNSMQTSSLNIGVIVVIGVNPLLRSAYNRFKRIYDTMTISSRREMYMVALEHKAYQIIEEQQAKREQSSTNL